MSKYRTYYDKAVSLMRDGLIHPQPQDVAGDFPANQEYKIAVKAIDEAWRKAWSLYCKAHPRHRTAVRGGSSEQECFRIWKEEGGYSYIKELN